MLNKKRHEKMTRVAETHRSNLQKNLQRRLDAAKASGDESLVRQLEMEASYIGL
jgi:plasmid maintenance system killer protein